MQNADINESPQESQTNAIPFQFSGTGGEYFGIWLSNIFFTVITLGIYSPWAKVRNTRYFYRHTSLDGAHFDYHANPLAILKGRVIAIVVFIAYTVLSELHVAILIIGTLLLLIVIPWVIVRALKFRFVNTSYRNVRMGFDGNYAGAAKAFILMPLLIVPTLGLAWPYIQFVQKRYIVSHLRFGQSRFAFAGSWVPWFKAGLPLVIIALFGIAIPGIYASIKMSQAVVVGEPSEEFPDGEPSFEHDVFDGTGVGLVASLIPFAILGLYIALPYYIVTTRNLLFEASTLDEHGFISTMRTLKYTALVIASFVIVMFTFGLGTPLAKVIMARYKADTLAVRSDGDFDAFLTQAEDEVRALGDELGEAFDIDLGV